MMPRLIERHAEDRLLMIDPDGTQISEHAWLDRIAASDIAAWCRLYVGQRVAVLTSCNLDRARTLLLLDGVAASLQLLSADLPGDALRSLLARGHPHRILISANTAVDPPEGVPYDILPNFALSYPAAASGSISVLPIADTEWILATSGTTKTPKLVCHSLQSLSRTVRRRFAAVESLKWGLLYDLNRFAGLQVFLQAMIGGDVLLIPPANARLSDTLAWLAQQGCDAISATPTLWRKLLMTPESVNLDLKQITLGGEIADQFVIDALRKHYPKARIVHIYASTEAGVGFAVSDGQEGFPTAFLGQAVKGADLRVDEGGLLRIRPPAANQRYLGEDMPLADEDGFVITGDRVEVKDNRVLFRGRENGAINVGGNKVQPEEVERVLLEHPEVALAVVGAKRSSITGALVEARIVPSLECADPSGLPRRLHEWCSQRLPRYKVPALIRIETDMPTNATGKIARQL